MYFPATYASISMILTGISIVFTVMILSIHHQTADFPPPKFLQFIILNILGRITCISACRKPVSTETSSIVSPVNDDVIIEDMSDEKTIKGFADKMNNMLVHENSTSRDIRDYLKMLVEKNKEDDIANDIETKWKLMAKIIDRFLFVIGLIGLSVNVGITFIQMHHLF